MRLLRRVPTPSQRERPCRVSRGDRNSLPRQRLFISWNELIWREINQFVRRNGGQVTFLEVPVSSYVSIEATTPIGQAEVKRFAEVAAGWGTVLIAPKFETDDSDFPDLSHLRASRTTEYSRAVVEALLRQDLMRRTRNVSSNPSF